MRDPAMRQAARDHVKGALEFRGSPSTIKSVNNDSNPNNNIIADPDGECQEHLGEVVMVITNS